MIYYQVSSSNKAQPQTRKTQKTLEATILEQNETRKADENCVVKQQLIKYNNINEKSNILISEYEEI